jgi:hypothetical protein
LSLLFGARPSHADPPGPNALPIHVVTIKTEESDLQAYALSAALKAEVRRLQGWSLGHGDYSLEVMTLALRCPWPPDAACELRIADEIKAARYIWGTLDENGKGMVRGTLHMWTRDQGRTRVDLEYSANLTEAADEGLRKIVRDALATLTGGPPKGSITIQAGNVNGLVFVDGQPSGAIRNGQTMILVPAGKHRVEVRASGYAPVAGDVSVQPSSTVPLSLTPVIIQAPDVEKSGSSLRRVGAYSAILAGGALAVGGVYSALKVNIVNDDEAVDLYRKGTPKGVDMCSAADDGVVVDVPGAATPRAVSDKCSTASTFQTLQWVFLGLSAVSIGAGSYLLATDTARDKQTPASAWLRVLPAAGPDGGGVDLHLRF